MYQIQFTVASLLALGRFSSIQAFIPKLAPNNNVGSGKMLASNHVQLIQTSSFSFISSKKKELLRMSSDVDENESLSFDDAGAAITSEDEKARAERSGNKLTEEDQVKFEAKQSEYESMREKIRSRASDLNISKSVTTQQAIEEANRRALAREEPQELDLSKFGMGSIGTEPEDELTEEQMGKVDKVGQMNILEQAIEEFKMAKFPGVGATLRQTGLMLVIFAFTASYILFLDNTVRDFYTDVLKIIPRSDAVFDYSDLELPEGWTDMMDEVDIMQQ